MNKRTFGVCFVLLFVILPSVSFSYGAGDHESVTSDVGRSGSLMQRQLSENFFGVDVWIFLAGHYGFWDLNVRDEVVVNITLNLVEPPTDTYVVSAVIWFSLSGVENLPAGARYTYGFWGFPPVGILSVYLPANVSYASVRLTGYLTGSSVFWRNTAEVFFSNVTSSVVWFPSYRLVLVPPSRSRVLRVYSRMYPDLRYEDVSVEGQRRIVVPVAHLLSPVVVLYEPETWEANAIILMFVTILLVFAVPYVSKSKKSNDMLSRLNGVLRRFSPSKLVVRLVAVFKRLSNEILKLDSSKLLHVYILCALLMVSLSFGFGPDPRLRVYVLSSTPENAKIISNFIHGQGGVAITVFDEMTEFELLVDLGVFSAVIVGDFFPPTERMVKGFIYPAFDSVARIVVVKRYAFDEFSSEVLRRYSEKSVIVEDLAALGSVLRGIPRRTNALGLDVSPGMYMGASAIVGLLSFVLVFFGFAFLACKLIEVGKKPKLWGFPEVVVYSVLVFVFTQVIYVVSSVLLAMPLGLHTSSPKVTAVGFMGFGGGSRPRMLGGFVGFLFGALVSFKEGLKLDVVGILSFVVMGFFVIIDPITSGILFYEFVLLFTVGPGMEFSYTTWSYIRMFLGSVAEAFGAWISPVYGTSTGIMLYYAGAIPFGLFSRLKRATATILLLSSAFFVADGGLRVADMMPWKAFASLIPGVTVGLVFVLIFYLISLAEMTIRMKIGKRNSLV